MNRVDDERVCFYLKHQKLINEWASIEEQANAAANQFLASCSEGVQSLCPGLGGGVRVHVLLRDDAKWPHIYLIRPAWQLSEEEPLVGIGLGWDRRDVSFAGEYRPYTCVGVEVTSARGQNLDRLLSGRFATIRKERGYTKEESWPVYRYEPPPAGAFWDDLTPFRNQLVESVRTAWLLFAPEVDAAMSELVLGG